MVIRKKNCRSLQSSSDSIIQMKFTIKRIFWILLTAMILNACQENKGPVLSEISVSGTFRNAANMMIHLSELDVKATKHIDSAELDEDGRFSFKIKPDGSVFLLISTVRGQQLLLVADPGEKIHIEADAHELVKTAGITGSPSSILMLEFDRYDRRNQEKADSLGQVFLSSRSDLNFALIRQHIDSAYQSIAEDQRRYSIQFIEQNPGSLASLIVLNSKFGPNDVFIEESDYRYFQKSDSALMNAYPGNKHVLDHHRRVEAMIVKQHESIVTDSLLAPGMTAPEVRLNNEEGNPVTLSSLKGKVTLVYFWAAMDAPGRRFIRQLIPVYKAYRKKGFEIFGIALEPNRILWLNAVKLDKPGGYQVNAVDGLKSPEAALFGVKKLPDAILIDREGKILERNIGLEELKKVLPGLLK